MAISLLSPSGMLCGFYKHPWIRKICRENTSMAYLFMTYWHNDYGVLMRSHFPKKNLADHPKSCQNIDFLTVLNSSLPKSGVWKFLSATTIKPFYVWVLYLNFPFNYRFYLKTKFLGQLKYVSLKNICEVWDNSFD